MIWKTLTKKKLIGSGSFGDVFKVTNSSGETGALKVIHKEFHVNRLQFKSAFEAAKKIDDINCLKMYEWVSDREVSWTMEYIAGETIDSLKFTDSFSLDQILKIMIQVCNGLIALHSRNIIHRDLKPENILIDTDGIAKITDFDFIKTGFSEKKLGQFIGTPEYSSPEHFIASYELDTRSDLYSLGVILYELLTGKLPFSGKTAKEIGDSHRLKPLIIPTKINTEISQNVEKIIIGLLEKEPNDRYQNAHSVAADLLKEIKDKKGIKIKKDVSYLLKPKFVNRTTPLKTLNKLSEKLKNKNGKVVLILGESGIGKSKLVQQFFYHLQLQDIRFYQSICKTVESSFNPLHKIFEGIISDKSETEKLKCFGEFGWDLVRFGILSKQDWMKKIKKPAGLTGKNAEIRLFGAITDFLKKSATKSLVICIDDLHWADEQILKWFKYAERNLKGFPVLIIGLHRSEQLFDDSKLLQIENLIKIKIKNLKGIDVSEMIKSMLGKKSSSKELDNFIKSIVSHSKGNPLFIREILYYLQETGKITIENNRWSFPQDLELLNLPADVYRIIQERLHELSNQTLLTIQTASIIGKKFSFEMLLNMTGKTEEELLNDLIDCREVSLIEESGNDYVFIHDKVREVLETEIKEKYHSFWKEQHLKAGEFLEEKYSSNPAEVLDDLANHFYFANSLEKSIKYNELAGDKAQKNYQNKKALEFYENIINNIEKQLSVLKVKDLDHRDLTKRLFDVQIKKSVIFKLIGDWNKAMSNSQEALKIAEDLDDKKSIGIATNKIGMQYSYQGNLDKAMECYEKYLKISEELGFKNGINTVLSNMGIVYAHKGVYDKSMECFSRNLKLGEDSQDKFLILESLGNMGNVYRMKGDYEKALDCYDKVTRSAEKLGKKRAVSTSIGNKGIIFFKRGDYDKAMELFSKHLKIATEIGDKNGISIALGNIANVYSNIREYKKAMENYEKKIKIDEELGKKLGICIASGNIGNLYYSQGNNEKALEWLNKKLEIAKELKNERHISETMQRRGTIFAEQGKLNKAIKNLESSLEISEKLGDKYNILQNYANLGITYYLKDDYKSALDNYKRALSLAKKMKVTIMIPSLYSGIIETLLKMKSYKEAKTTNEEAKKIAEDTKNENWIFEGQILDSKIFFKTIKNKELKIRNCIKPLEKMLEEVKNKEQTAKTIFELAIMNYELKRKQKAEKHKKTAIELFTELYKNDPKIEFKNRIERLRNLN